MYIDKYDTTEPVKLVSLTQTHTAVFKLESSTARNCDVC